jgi:hypothetical protein
MSDKYDDAIAYLTEHPDEVENAWKRPYTYGPIGRTAHVAGCLFQGVCRTAAEYYDVRNPMGCLTQLKMYPDNYKYACSPETREEIIKDPEIPARSGCFSLDDLQRFAYWQRRLDQELNREV